MQHPKKRALEHGRITPDYIEYNRRDVLATQELLVAARREFDAHPIALNPCSAYSPASIAKGYLRALGVARPDELHELVVRVVGRDDGDGGRLREARRED